jgi:hypothetical protein
LRHRLCPLQRQAHLDAFDERRKLLDHALRKSGVVAPVRFDVTPGVEDEEVQVDVACGSVKAEHRLLCH